MHSIQYDIQHLIQEQDFLVLPGIGSFLAGYSKPYFDDNGDIVMPKKYLEFNQLIDRDEDNKLFELLSKKISRPVELVKASYYDFLNHFRSTLVLNNKFEWENLGTFYRNENQEILFYSERKIEKDSIHQENRNTAASSFTINEITEIDNQDDNVDYDSEYSGSKPKNYLRSLLYLIPLFIIITTLAYTVFIKPNNKKTEKQNMVEDIDSLATIQKILYSNSNPSLEETELSSKKDFNRSEKNSNPESKEELIDSTRKSHIVGIGVFKVKENVDNLAEYLAENGIPAKVRRAGGKYKLFVTASSEEQANEFVKKIEQLTGEKAVYENN
jgi:cell division septation protein DedD